MNANLRMPNAESLPNEGPGLRRRYRLRFRKEGGLCWIGHQDLMRAVDRTFRRAGVPLAMAGDYRARPRLSFPSALALGIAARNEVCEAELEEAFATDELLARLQRHAPPGLTFVSAMELPAEAPAAQACAVEYELHVPAERRRDAQTALERLLAAPHHWITRDDARARPVDVRADILQLELGESTLRMRMRVSRTATARPREVLAALLLDDLERAQGALVRTVVELA